MKNIFITYPAWKGKSTPGRPQGGSGLLFPIVVMFHLVISEASGAAEPLDELHELINGYRQHAGLSSLERNGELDRVATRHNSDMAQDEFFAHCAPDGSCLKERLQTEGYEAWLSAENLAAGQATPTQVLEAWDQSAEHRHNLRLEAATQIGLSIRYHGNNTAPSPLWTVVIAQPR